MATIRCGKTRSAVRISLIKAKISRAFSEIYGRYNIEQIIRERHIGPMSSSKDSGMVLRKYSRQSS